MFMLLFVIVVAVVAIVVVAVVINGEIYINQSSTL